MHGFEHAKLPRHVVRFGSHGPHRRSAQHVFAITRAHQIREIRMAAWKLLDGHVTLGPFDSAAQISTQRAHIDLFTRANGSNLGKHR